MKRWMILAPFALAACFDDPVGPSVPDLDAHRTGRRADPPVILLHYDYMVAPDHSHEPQPETIRTLVRTYLARGIAVVIDPRHDAIPEIDCLVYDRLLPEYSDYCAFVGGSTMASYFELKEQYFQPKGPLPWHYAIFGHHGCFEYACGYFSGLAEVPGYNFMVVLGGFWHELITPDIREQHLPPFETGVLLHELGHNLGLGHGGSDDLNWKPNYVSVMNYNYTAGIKVAAAPGSLDSVGVRFDYSDRVLPTMDEAHLDERVGLGVASADLVPYACLPPDRSYPDFVEARGPAAGPIDWNCDGRIDPDVAQDLTLDSRCGSPFYPCYDLLTGFDDWKHIKQFVRSSQYTSRSLRAGPVTP